MTAKDTQRSASPVSQNGSPKAWALQRLPVFPAVASRLVNMVSQEDASFRKVADLIGRDTALTADLMRLANSPLFGLRLPIRSVLHAISVLGVSRVKTLALTIALRNFALPAAGLEVFKESWRHSLACAFGAEEIAVACSRDKDEAYTAGLMHDIGRLALLAAYPEQYGALVKQAQARQQELIEAERETFEVDHCFAGGKLLREWKFPAEICEAALQHHLPPDPTRFGTTQLVQAGCRMAAMLGFQLAGKPREWNVAEILTLIPSASRQTFQDRSDGLGLRILDKINSTECSLMF